MFANFICTRSRHFSTVSGDPSAAHASRGSHRQALKGQLNRSKLEPPLDCRNVRVIIIFFENLLRRYQFPNAGSYCSKYDSGIDSERSVAQEVAISCNRDNNNMIRKNKLVTIGTLAICAYGIEKKRSDDMCANFSGEGIITHVQLLIINYCFVVMPSLAGSYEVSPYL